MTRSLPLTLPALTLALLALPALAQPAAPVETFSDEASAKPWTFSNGPEWPGATGKLDTFAPNARVIHIDADAAEINKLDGYEVINRRPFFKEFVVRCPHPALEIAQQLTQQKILPGYVLSNSFPDRMHDLLVCVTEMNSKAQIDQLMSALKEVA